MGVSSPPDSENFSLQDAIYFNGTPVTVVVTCPPGATACTPGDPVVVDYPPETFVFPDVPVIPGQPIVLALQGCQSLVSVTLPAGSSPALIQFTVNSIIQQVAAQQAICDFLPPLQPPNATISLGDLFPNACLGRVYDQFVQATTNPVSVPISFNVTGTLPPGITLFAINNTQAFFYGTATTAGAYTFTVTATAPNGVQVAKAFTINVIGITTASPLTDAIIGEVYSVTLAQAGMAGTLIWGIASGSLPVGLTLNSSTGEIAGIPTVLGGSIFTVFVQNATQQCVKSFSLTVQSPVSGCGIFNDLVWDAPAITIDGSASASGTSSGNEFSATTSCDASNGINNLGEVIFHSTFNYTGPELTCCLDLVGNVTGLGGGNAQITQDGGNILFGGVETALAPFTIAESLVPSVIEITIRCRSGASAGEGQPASTSNFAGTFGSCP